MDDLFRWYNLIVAVGIAVVGTPQLQEFLTRGGRDQLLWQSVILLNVTAFWGTFESLRAGYPAGFRVYLLSMALTWLFVAVCYGPWERRQERRGATMRPITRRTEESS